jgi:lipopolysaccharide transport system ATP-binding protein
MPMVITVENLAKRYLLQHQAGQQPYLALRDVLSESAHRLGRRLLGRTGTGAPAAGREEFWALREVSFAVGQGERIGIIGRNGAGKSTLLKILSRITEPSAGRVRIRGRVASLLEVGTGFHPELTGRENIFLNGAILGMGRAEIRKKFDEIVEFAEIERFLDTPVKRYSSGMYVRLAFAVAAHIEPEILIIDEVLAVGDVQFQKKCMTKMEQVGEQGRTVLFVSHNMQAIRQFCSRAILLEKGRLVADGPSEAVVTRYLETASSAAQDALGNIREVLAALPADPVLRLDNIQILQNGKAPDCLVNGEPVVLQIDYEVFRETCGLHIYFQLFDNEGTLLLESINNGDCEELPITAAGRYCSRVAIPADFLAPVKYEMQVWAGIANVRACLPKPIQFSLNVVATGRVNRAYPGYQTPGKLAPWLPWTITAAN